MQHNRKTNGKEIHVKISLSNRLTIAQQHRINQIYSSSEAAQNNSIMASVSIATPCVGQLVQHNFSHVYCYQKGKDRPYMTRVLGPARQHHAVWSVLNYTAWWQRHMCEQLAQSCYLIMQRPGVKPVITSPAPKPIHHQATLNINNIQ